MSKDVYSSDQLLREIAGVVRDILYEDIKPEAERIFKNEVETTIYKAYVPRQYVRRHNIGSNIYTDITSKRLYTYHFEITSDETANKSITRFGTPVGFGGFKYGHPGAFVEMLEVGNMGWWRKHFPRPVISNTQIKFNSGELDKTISDAISNKIG